MTHPRRLGFRQGMLRFEDLYEIKILSPELYELALSFESVSPSAPLIPMLSRFALSLIKLNLIIKKHWVTHNINFFSKIREI